MVEYYLLTSVASFFGGWATFMTGAFSYITDVSRESHRTARIAVAEMFMASAYPFGNIISAPLYWYIHFLKYSNGVFFFSVLILGHVVTMAFLALALSSSFLTSFISNCLLKRRGVLEHMLAMQHYTLNVMPLLTSVAMLINQGICSV